ncbi:glycosyltransferase family 8 protein [Lacticaseibacillus sp. GG6-2]
MIPIFYCIDDQYAPVFAAALQSLQAHAQDPRGYHVRVLYTTLSASNQAALRAQITDPKIKLECIRVDEQLLAQITDTGNKLRCDYFTFTIYLRLFIAELFPKLTKAVYLDADTICLDDVSHLFDQPTRNNLVAAASDPFIADDPITANYAQKAIGVPASAYVNSGVLVMNLQAMREAEFTAHFLQLLHTYHFKSLAPDQDYLNAIAQNRIQPLDGSFNRQGTDSGPARLVHYNLFAKPWHYQDVPYAQEFWRYAEQTTYASTLHQTLANYDQQAQDTAHMQTLVDAAATIPESENTFAKLRDAGIAVAL